jgi:CII-binding regulator of phage lambda lysogenization HflD
VEAHEIAERIHEDAEEHAPAHRSRETMFRRLAAIYVGVVAMLQPRKC